MKLKQLFSHAWVMARRELNAGEFHLTVFALIIGVAAVMALSLTSSRVEKTMLGQAADLIGGDLIITSSQAPSESLIQSAAQAGLSTSLSVSFSTMVGFGEEFQLSSIRAVDDRYPLKGHVIVRKNVTAPTRKASERPAQGDAWVEKRLLDKLGLEPGGSIEIGYSRFKVVELLEMEPDRGGSFYSFYPRVLINWQDLTETGLVQPGSRVFYKLMLAGGATNIDRWRDRIEPQLKANQRLLDPENSESSLSQSLDRAKTFISLGSLMSVILCGIAVSLAASRHARRHINQVALLRCFGLKSRQVNLLYSLQLFLISLPAIIVGAAVGYFLHLILTSILSEFFQTTLPEATASAWLSGPITALCMIIGFGLPPLLRLSNTPPVRVLRKEFGPSRRTPILSAGIALIALTLIAWWQTDDAILALSAIGVTVALISVLLGLIFLILKLTPGSRIRQPALRGAYANLVARPTLTAMQVTGFGLSVFTVALILLFRHDLFQQWNAEIPDNAPNRFAFNILDVDKAEFEQVVKNEIGELTIYPVTRGRLVKINDKIVQQAVSKEKNNEEALDRDLALTQFDRLPFENVITAGNFVTELSAIENSGFPVSVEERLGENLGLELDDKLEFLIEGQSLVANITSFRSVNWENFNPNFYMIFPPGTLDNFSKTWLTSFYSPAEKRSLDNIIGQRFKGITLIDVDFMLDRIRRILNQVSSAMELIFAMTLFAGVAVFWAALLITFDEKQKQAALFRALGASRQMVIQRLIYEHSLIGLFAGLIASIALTIVSWLVSVHVLDIAWQFPLLYCLTLPLLLMLSLTFLGSLQIQQILATPPYRILQHTEAI